MELKRENIKDMSIREIFNKVSPMINGIYGSFKYLEIPKDDFAQIVFEAINNSKVEYNSTKSYSDYLKSKIKFNIIEKERKLISDNKEIYRIASNYIKYNIHDVEGFNESIKAFKKIESVFFLFQCEIDTYVILDLLKNDDFNKIVNNIMQTLLPNLSRNKIESIYNSSIFVLVMETYADIHNIELSDTDDMEIENGNVLDDDLRTFFKDIGQKKVLSPQEEKELFERYRNGDIDAKNEIIECNLKLAVNIARKAFYKTHNNSIWNRTKGLSFQDLIQEASLGIIRAIEKYNPEKGCRFSTYAYNWIWQFVTRAMINKDKTVRIPVYLYSGLPDYFEKVNILTKELQRDPTVNDIVERFNYPVKKAMLYHELLIEEKSLNELVGEEKTKEVEDYFNHSENDVEETVFKSQLEEDFQRVFEMVKLDPREFEILKYRYGLYNNELETLQSIADKLGLTRERIRQLELRAINKIRRNRLALEILAAYTANPENVNKVISSGYSNKIKTLDK